MKKIAVVIVNYKLKDEVLKCVQSVKDNDYKDLQIILVDNNSNDGLEKEKGKDILFIQTGKNLGYAGGNNIGIKKALEAGCDFIFILNPDTTIDKKAIDVLVKKAKSTQGDILGPKIYFNSSKKIWFAGGKFDKLNVLGSHIGVDEVDRGQYENEVEVDFVTGAAMFVKREVFEKIGYFDEKYFLYYEDSDFCFRAKKAGFKIIYIPTAIIYHQNAKSTGLGSSLQDYFITRNRLVFASKFLNLRTQIALFKEALRNFKNPNRRRALIDFIICNLGKGSLNI